MRRGLWLAFLLCWLSLPVQASEVESGQLVPLGYCQLTSLSSAVLISTCTGGIPTGAQISVIVPETQAVRYRDDGTAPTATVGMPLTASGSLTYQGDLTKVQLIEQTASAKANIAFYKYLR